ncbi:MAG: 30S ribosomal protein S6 [Candidatus Vogelbacteria bacterium]|nr:30S ribosomal protein S6 [Candidatus Vogelbacteria bacterium]
MEAVNKVEKVAEEHRRYEIGFLLSPLLTEESLADTIKTVITSTIEASKGTVESVTTPKRLALAYPVAKVIDHKRSNFKEAYLGAVVFTAPTEATAKILQTITNATVVIRTLLIEKLFHPIPEVSPRESRSVSVPKTLDKDTAAIDKEIEELLV